MHPTRLRTLIRAACIAALVSAPVAPAAIAPKPRPAPRLDDATIVHVLDRMAFGAAPGDVERVRAKGLDRYIEEQLQPKTLPDTEVEARLAGFDTLSLSSRDIAGKYYEPLLAMRRERQRNAAASPDRAASQPSPSEAFKELSPEERRRVMAARRESQLVLAELGQQKLLRAVYSQRQLQEVLVDFWFNHFNVFAGKGPVQAYLTEYERDAIRPYVSGRFRDLLGAVAHSPAMLFYLDNWQSIDPAKASKLPARQAARPNAPRGLNENYARELLELHTLGVDGGYTQADVVEVARAFTGWTIRGPRQGGGFWFDERRHASGPKQVLGRTIDEDGERDGEAVLDLLARHPATATFIATKLTRRFVADDPPPAVVERAAAAFRKTDGNLAEVVRAILTSPEFLSAKARGAKVKNPFEFVASALRASAAEITDATALVRHLRELGMPLYFAQPPTGYADRADAWINAGALLARMNFAVALVNDRIPGVHVDAASFAREEGAAAPQRAALMLGSAEFQRR